MFPEFIFMKNSSERQMDTDDEKRYSSNQQTCESFVSEQIKDFLNVRKHLINSWLLQCIFLNFKQYILQF